MILKLVCIVLTVNSFVATGWSYKFECINNHTQKIQIKGDTFLDGAYALELKVVDNNTHVVLIDKATELSFYINQKSFVVHSSGKFSVILYEKIRGATRLIDDRIYETRNICND